MCGFNYSVALQAVILKYVLDNEKKIVNVLYHGITDSSSSLHQFLL